MALVKENGIWKQVTVGNPAAKQWVVKYRLNMETIPAHNFKTEGDTLTLSGSTWSVVNKDNASVLGFNGSSGLKIDPANGSNLFSGGDTAPRIMCQINDMVGGDWNPNTQTVACIMRMTSSTGVQANFDSFGMVMTPNTGAISSGQNDKFCKSGPLHVTEANYDVSDGTEYDVENNTGTDADCVIMTIYPGGQIRTRGGVFGWGSVPSAKFPLPKDNTDWSSIHSTAVWNKNTTRYSDNPGAADDTLLMSGDKWAVGPFSFEVSSGTGMEAVFREFIVLRLE